MQLLIYLDLALFIVNFNSKYKAKKFRVYENEDYMYENDNCFTQN